MKINLTSFMNNVVNLNMRIAIVYLLLFIGFAVYMSIYHSITEVPLMKLLFGISLISIVCIPFFSYFNISNMEEFSLLDFILNLAFIIICLGNLFLLYTILF